MIADRFDVFLFDLDGVIYLGERLLPEVRSAVSRLQSMGKTVRFLTNDPRPTRAQVTERLRALGLEIRKEQVFTSAWATVQYLKKRSVDSVFVLGTPAFLDELRAELSGVSVSGDDRPQAVVVGYDDAVTFREVQQAVRYIESGADFIATNGEPSFPTPEGKGLATGSLVRAIQEATGKRPCIIGKPSPIIFRMALEDVPKDARVVMIGDSPETDILGAHQMGLTAILVSEKSIRFPFEYDFRSPDAVISDLSSLFDSEKRVREWRPPPFLWPERLEPGVAAVVLNAPGDVLLVKRRDNGLWGLPSGHVERGETVAEAVKREVREETGLDVEVERLIGVYSDPASQVFHYPSGEVVQFVTLSFLCRVVGGTLCADGVESSEVKFFKPSELPHDILTMHPLWLKDAQADRPQAFIR